jgi:hypothetical protein
MTNEASREMTRGELIAENARLRTQLAAARSIEEALRPVTGEQINRLVDRFLAWPLPKSVRSDPCVTMTHYAHSRSGTNLLTADEARQMFRYLLYCKEFDET